MLSVRPSRCHSDNGCFSQVLLGNHSSPKPGCLGVSHRTQIIFCLPSSLLVCFIPFLCLLSPPPSLWTQLEDLLRWKRVGSWKFCLLSRFTYTGTDPVCLKSWHPPGGSWLWSSPTWDSAISYCCAVVHAHPLHQAHTHAFCFLRWFEVASFWNASCTKRSSIALLLYFYWLKQMCFYIIWNSLSC